MRTTPTSFLLSFALALAGCPTDDAPGGGGDDRADSDHSDDTDSETGEDNGGIGGDTGGPSGEFDSVAVRLSDTIETVIIVDWVLDATAESVWVEYGSTDTYGQIAPVRAAYPDQALVLGTAPGTTVHLRVVADVGDTLVYSDDHTITTGEPPRAFPEYEVQDKRSDVAFGEFVMTSYFNSGPGESAVLVFNRAGDIVWHSEIHEGLTPAARPSRDGQAVVYLTQATVTDPEDSHICRTELDGEHTTCLETPYCHHDFVELEDGRYVCTQEVVGEWREFNLVGDSLQAWDETGEAEEIWNAFTDIEPHQEDWWSDHITSRGTDWTHANGIWHDEANEDWYVSFYYFQSVHKIDGATGASEWVLGGDLNDFRFRGQRFGPQHAPQLIDGGILLFDNDSQEDGSQIVSYELDESGMEATVDMSWTHDAGRYAAVLGDAHLLPNGYVATGWGDVGQVVIYEEGGEELWRFSGEAGTTTCQVYVYDDLYTMSPN